MQQIFEAIFGDNLTNIVNGEKLRENFDTIVGRAVGGTKRIPLTGNMTTQTAQAKLYEWNGSAYVAVGARSRSTTPSIAGRMPRRTIRGSSPGTSIEKCSPSFGSRLR